MIKSLFERGQYFRFGNLIGVEEGGRVDGGESDIYGFFINGHAIKRRQVRVVSIWVP